MTKLETDHDRVIFQQEYNAKLTALLARQMVELRNLNDAMVRRNRTIKALRAKLADKKPEGGR